MEADAELATKARRGINVPLSDEEFQEAEKALLTGSTSKLNKCRKPALQMLCEKYNIPVSGSTKAAFQSVLYGWVSDMHFPVIWLLIILALRE